MARTARASVGGHCYHVLNRTNDRGPVFRKPSDYLAFVRLMADAGNRVPIRVLSYCIMPNHFHFVSWPVGDDDLSRWMHWLLTTHVSRHHRAHGTSGRLWQGRFKAFPIQRDAHLLTVLRYVERNPLRANLVARAETWPWSSLQPDRRARQGLTVTSGPVERPPGWTAWVNVPQTSAEIEAVRRSLRRGAPFGDPVWTADTAEALGLQPSVRPRGRPRRNVRRACS